jgi:serine phosphatase RsbU (regulator of sigma subunit)
VAADGGGARFGVDRLIALVEEHGAASPAAVRDAIIAAVAAFSARRDDDVTLLVARYTGP